SSSLRRARRRGEPRPARCCRAPPPRSESFSSSPSKGPICKANQRESQTRHSFERALGVGEGERVAIDRGKGGGRFSGRKELEPERSRQTNVLSVSRSVFGRFSIRA